MPEQYKKPNSSRRLSAIMFADIAGYTALMQKDESKSSEVLSRFQSEMYTKVAEHKGSIVNEMGDGMLCVFDTPNDAVRCAMSLKLSFDQDPYVPVRLGIHSGTVVTKGGKVYGDSVNVTSRIESMGVPGAVLISNRVRRDIKNQADIKTTSLGSFNFKNVDEPLEVYAISNEGFAVPDRKELKGKFEKKSGFSRPLIFGSLAAIIVLFFAQFLYFKFSSAEKPESVQTIAVLPLMNLNPKDDNLEYFSDGLTQEIIYELAKIKSFSITAFTTSIAYKSSTKSQDEIAQELNVEYLVSGSSRIFDNGNRVKVVIELFDPLSKKVIWTETFDEDFNDVTTIQVTAVKDIAISLDVAQSSLEKLSFNSVNTKSGEAFRLFLKAKSEIYKLTPTGYETTRKILNQALEIDSNYAQAHTLMAWNLVLEGGSWFQGYNRSTTETVELALPHIEKSIKLNPESSDIYLIRGNLNLHHRNLLRDAKKDIDYALKVNSWPRIPTDYCICTVVATYSALGEMEIAKSLAILGREVDPGNVFISFDQALIHMLEGRMKEAQSLLETSVSIVDIPYFNFYLGWSYYHDNQFEKALESFEKAYQFDEWSIGFNVAYLSNSYLKLGEQQMSDKYLNELLEREKSGENHVNLSLAMIYAARNDTNKTLEYLEIALLKRDYAFAYMINTDLIFRPYYKEQRFIDLRKKVQFYE